MEPIDCPKTSVANYQSTLRNIPEERRPHTTAEAWNPAFNAFERPAVWHRTDSQNLTRTTQALGSNSRPETKYKD
jgi:hypothetical protein